MEGYGNARRISEEIERQTLAPYASFSSASLGRRYPEEPDEYRTAFQRDRDRILYSTAFRRLQYKTQVYVIHEGDAYRTRLTHTLEVMQHARTLARVLRANEDLTEAIALAHDLGHAPFGHGGEEELDRLLADQGGFEHNRQGLRIVDRLERRYATFPGLNLCYETREGLARHTTRYDRPSSDPEFATPFPGLECQIVNLADQLAFCAHDLDDALRSGLLSLEEVAKAAPPLIGRILAAVDEREPRELRRRLLIRGLIDRLTRAAIEESRRRLEKSGVDSPKAVREYGEPLIALPSEVEREFRALQDFLHHAVYEHPAVRTMVSKGQAVLRALFLKFSEAPELLPRTTQARLAAGEDPPARVIGDYLAGMTDRHAVLVYRKIFDPETPVGMGFGD
ncbi:MAG: deoxyguanosinetriphosphate triphosphohydrolase [Bacillota bacterium]